MLPCFDNHVHLRPDGFCLEAARKFKLEGGTHLNLIVSPIEIERTEDYYKNIYDITIKIAERIRKELNLIVLITLGPHPADISVWLRKFSLEESLEIMKNGIDLAAKYIEDRVAHAIGEVGRPHYTVSKEILEASNEVMRYAMKVAKIVDCPVILHTESPSYDTFKELARFADEASLDRWRVIKHYSPPYILENENHGIFPSIIASRKNVVEAIEKGRRFFMETDYIDDRGRPDAVLPITSVPRRNRMLIEKKLATKEDLYVIHVENVEKVFGIELRL